MKLSNARRAARDRNESASLFDFIRTAKQAITNARPASASQIRNRSRYGRPNEQTPALNAVRPISTPPHPGTAVKEAARSIVSRINRKLSAARRSIGIGSFRIRARCTEAIRDIEYTQDARCGVHRASIREYADFRQALCHAEHATYAGSLSVLSFSVLYYRFQYYQYQRYVLNSITSPSCTTYSLPSVRIFPSSLARANDPAATRSS